MNLTQVYASRIAEVLAERLHGERLMDYDNAERLITDLTPTIARLIEEYHSDADLPAPKLEPRWTIQEFGQTIKFDDSLLAPDQPLIVPATPPKRKWWE